MKEYQSNNRKRGRALNTSVLKGIRNKWNEREKCALHVVSFVPPLHD